MLFVDIILRDAVTKEVKSLRSIEIVNTDRHKDRPRFGNYEVKVAKGAEIQAFGQVEDWDRENGDAIELLYEALSVMIDKYKRMKSRK